MAKKPKFWMDKRKMQVIRLIAEGRKLKDIIIAVFSVLDENGVDSDRKKDNNAYAMVQGWMRVPEFQEEYRNVIREMAYVRVGKASAVFDRQMDDTNPWVAAGAAREVLARFAPYVMGAEEQSITVKIEGMPELGVPETDESDDTE